MLKVVHGVLIVDGIISSKSLGELKEETDTLEAKKHKEQTQAYKELRPKASQTYTPRQQAIITGDIPVEDVRTNEISNIMRKAERIDDMDTFDRMSAAYRMKTEPDLYAPKMSIEEAKKILQDLTPWEIDWENY